MKNLPTMFFATAAVFGLLGMVWGVQMSATGDHLLSPAHGHLNLIGFVGTAIFGTYYALSSQAATSGLAKAHYYLHVVTILVMTPGIVMAINEQGELLAKLGSVLAIVSLGLFLFIVVRNGVPDRAAQ